MLTEKIAEKQRLKEEAERKRLEEDDDNISPEEKIRMQKESDLKLALETTFGGSDCDSNLTTKEEFEEFSNSFLKKIKPFSASADFPTFAENLIRNLCATCKFSF